MKTKWTKEAIIKYIEEQDYIFINFIKFDKLSSRILIRCNNKKHKPYEVTFANFKTGKRCPKCSEIKRRKKRTIWNKEKIIDFVEDNNYEFIEFVKFDKIESIIKVWCKNLKHEPYNVKFANFKNGQRCRKCSDEIKSKNFSHNYEYVKEYIESFGYKMLSNEYINLHSEIKILCDKHGIYKTTFQLFKMAKYKCPKCSDEHRGEYHKLNYEYIKEYIESFGYEILSNEYINMKTNILVKCPNGHKSYFTNFDRFKRGDRCPYCNESKGEKKINEILNKYNMNFKSQYKFNNCKSKRELPFDFYISDLNIAIEYDGIQHYKIIEYFSGLDGFITTKIHDVIKTRYCEDNNIKLIRIPYWEYDDIESILIKELNLK